MVLLHAATLYIIGNHNCQILSLVITFANIGRRAPNEESRKAGEGEREAANQGDRGETNQQQGSRRQVSTCKEFFGHILYTREPL